MTNREKINKMTNEEIAIEFGFVCCSLCVFSIKNTCIGGHCNWKCIDGVSTFLNSEVKENEFK